MRDKIIAIIILLVGVGVAFFAIGDLRPFRLGLDLSGGTLLTYRADISKLSKEEVSDAMNSLRDVIERRVNLFGVSEPLVQVEHARIGEGEERLIVELPGVTNVDEAVRALGETPLLEFKLLDSKKAATVELSEASFTDPNFLEELYIPTGLSGRHLERANIVFDNAGGGVSGAVAVSLDFNDEGADLFRKITREHIGEVLAIFLDGIPISEPVIQSEIDNGSAVITGDFTPEEARDLARNLNFGALPIPIELIGTQSIGAVLGEKILGDGVRAGMYTFVLIALFMVLWYRLPGLVAVVALFLYGLLNLALYKLIPITLTAAGVAGFILSLGMAVDANILVFERLKEEIRSGKDTPDAIRAGFARAWLSIRDGNLTTILAAVILFYMTTSLVRGFALTLTIGVVTSMITALFVTRTLLLAVAPKHSKWILGSGLNSL